MYDGMMQKSGGAGGGRRSGALGDILPSAGCVQTKFAIVFYEFFFSHHFFTYTAYKTRR